MGVGLKLCKVYEGLGAGGSSGWYLFFIGLRLMTVKMYD